MEGTKREFRFASATGQGEIYTRVWQTAVAPRAVVQLAHGMAEHVDRYEGFGGFLNEHGILLVANDHAGHGKSMPDAAHQGYFAEHDGWSSLIADMRTVHAMMSAEYPDIPYILMGHSMGSFLARTYAARCGEGIAAFVFSGTAGANPAIAPGRLVARWEKRRNGPMQPSTLLNRLAFGSYNKKFKPARTDSDWLSRDTREVDLYVADPLCGFVFTAEAMLDLFDGLTEIDGPEWAKKVPNVPILLFSGDCDPVGNCGKGVKQVFDWLEDTGHSPTLRLYPGGRHEMLNEINREEVYRDTLSFLEEVLA